MAQLRHKRHLKRLILVSVLLVMLSVLATAPASNVPTDNVQVEDTTTKPSGNSTITITMTGVDDG